MAIWIVSGLTKGHYYNMSLSQYTKMDVGHVRTMAGHTEMAILHIKTVTTPQGGHGTYNDGHNIWFPGLSRAYIKEKIYQDCMRTQLNGHITYQDPVKTYENYHRIYLNCTRTH